MFKKVSIFICTAAALFAVFYYTINKQPKNDTIYIVSGNFGKLFDEKGNGFFNLPKVFKDHNLKVKQAYSLKRLKNVKYLVVFECFEKKLKHIKKYPKDKCILFLWEPASTTPQNYDKNNHRHFSKVYTWDDDLVDNKKYFKFYYPDAREMIKNRPSFNNKKLCCMIVGNKSSNHKDELYSKRKEAITFFENTHPNDFDLYGIRWDKKENPSYKGSPSDKAIMSNYKFSICYENLTNVNGYITEKIFDSFYAGCIPIYWGASNIADYIPENCYIDIQEFGYYEDLYKYLTNMKEDEYQQYLKNIQTFLKSEKAKPFSKDNFVKIFKQAVNIKGTKI